MFTKLLIVSALLLMSVGSCRNDVFTDLSKHKGYILIYRGTPMSSENGNESSKCIFRKGDIIWSGYYDEGTFSQYKIGDTIK